MRRKGSVNVTFDLHRCRFSPFIIISLNLIQTCMWLNIMGSLQMVSQRFSSSNHEVFCNESVFPNLMISLLPNAWHDSSKIRRFFLRKLVQDLENNICRIRPVGSSRRNSSRKRALLQDAVAVGQAKNTYKLSSNVSMQKAQLVGTWEINRVGWHCLHTRHKFS